MIKIINEVQTKRSKESLKELSKLTEYIPNNSIACEIGCYSGESTLAFCESGKIKVMYAVDPWKTGYDDNDIASFTNMELVEKKFDERMKGYNVIKLKMTIQKAFNLLPELDFVYIDGNHQYDYVINDIQLSLKKLKKNGIISGHDYGSKIHMGVTKAVQEIFNKPDIIFKDKSWLVKLNNFKQIMDNL